MLKPAVWHFGIIKVGLAFGIGGLAFFNNGTNSSEPSGPMDFELEGIEVSFSFCSLSLHWSTIRRGIPITKRGSKRHGSLAWAAWGVFGLAMSYLSSRAENFNMKIYKNVKYTWRLNNISFIGMSWHCMHWFFDDFFQQVLQFTSDPSSLPYNP